MTVPSSIPHTDIRSDVLLTDGWEMASAPAKIENPSQIGALTFVPVQVPCTVAAVLRDTKAWRMGTGVRFDASEYWFRCPFKAAASGPGEQIILRLEGIATVADVWLNGQPILKSSSMFASHEIDVTTFINDHNELVIACRSLAAALRERRRQQPALRWRTRVVAEQQLRWFRTTLLGRAPGFAPEPEPVGPWRPVSLIRRRSVAIENWSRKVSIEAEADTATGVVDLQFHLQILESGMKPVMGRLIVAGNTGEEFSAPLKWEASSVGGNGYRVHTSLRVPSIARWWPHTHGTPALYSMKVEFQLENSSTETSSTTGIFTTSVDDVPVGFRSLDPGASPVGDGGLSLHVNGVPVFCRGVIWTPPDPVALRASSATLRQRLELLRDGGINLIRLAGTTVYEDDTFHCLCDELGLLVWQDMMFANMDYPFADQVFHLAVVDESEQQLSRLSRHPSTAVICGNSEIEQQVAMLGLEPGLGRGSFFGEDLPGIAARCCPGVPYIPSAPCGGDLPFRTRSGVANYFGVGAYLRPLEDARRAEVRFASECLAFANVPEPEMLDEMALANAGGISPTHPAWKRGVPRDVGAGWDFEDVRDHYLRLLYAVDPAHLRYADSARYFELSRMVSGEVMAEVFGEWRRAASPCGGGIILWSADLEPGAGWGILDSLGRPKAAYWFLKRALAPRTVWATDEGLNGIDIHVANEKPEPLSANLRIAIYRGERRVEQASLPITIPPHQSATFGVEQILSRFVDAAYAYRFGPPGHDLIVASLHSNSDLDSDADRNGNQDDIPLAQAFHFPAGRSSQRLPISEIGLAGEVFVLEDGRMEVVLRSRRLAWGLRVTARGFVADDVYFGIEPGGTRRIVLVPARNPLDSAGRTGVPPVDPVVTAVNAEGRLIVATGRRG